MQQLSIRWRNAMDKGIKSKLVSRTQNRARRFFHFGSDIFISELDLYEFFRGIRRGIYIRV